jgi:hypothetical protein
MVVKVNTFINNLFDFVKREEQGMSVLSQGGGLARTLHCMRLLKREKIVMPLQRAAPAYEWV